MKFALLTTLLLAYSTLKATAMPSTVTKDIKAEEHKNNQPAIRTIDARTAVEAQAKIGPWASAAIGGFVDYVFSTAVSYVGDKFNEWKNAGFPPHVTNTRLRVLPGPEQPKRQDFHWLMENMVKGVSGKLGPDVGVLLIQRDAILRINFNNAGYEWMPVQLQKNPNVPNEYQDFDIVLAKQGSLDASANNPNGQMVLYQLGGPISVGVTNFGSPNAVNTFSFGRQ